MNFLKKNKNAQAETTAEVQVPAENDAEIKKSDLDVDLAVEDDTDEYPEPEKKGLSKLFEPKKPKKEFTFEDNPHLLTLRPRENYLFFSDYIKIDDDTFTCILAMFHNNGAADRFGQFWGLNLLPHNLPKTTKVIRFE